MKLQKDLQQQNNNHHILNKKWTFSNYENAHFLFKYCEINGRDDDHLPHEHVHEQFLLQLPL